MWLNDIMPKGRFENRWNTALNIFYVTFCWRSPYKKLVFKILANDISQAFMIVFNHFGQDFHNILPEEEFLKSKFSKYKVIGEHSHNDK